jgi:hypothetical protein
MRFLFSDRGEAKRVRPNTSKSKINAGKRLLGGEWLPVRRNAEGA